MTLNEGAPARVGIPTADSELLARYVSSGSEAAFAEVTERYSTMVFSTCLRILGDPSAAADATQATFIVLVRNARKLSRGTLLSGWLFVTAQNAARKLLRASARRAKYERESAMLRSKAKNVSWEEVRPELDAAIASLPRKQRDAIVLRYLQGRSENEAAAEMGCPRGTLSAWATRGLSKLREKLSRLGVAVPAATLAGLLGERTVEVVPAGLAASIQAVCLGKVAASQPVLSVTEDLMKSMMLAKIKMVVAAVCVTMALGGGGVVAVKRLAAAEPAAASAVKIAFTSGPVVKLEGGKLRVDFTVSAPTDVEMAILDGKGVVVRHLAAGLLGKNAPAPFKRAALGQSLAWDFKDDHGKQLPAGKYRVRVNLGLKPEFDRILGKGSNALDMIRGLAVGPKGELFVLNGFDSTLCNVLDREGNYKRTIMPYQVKCFPDRTKDFGILDLGAGGKYPFVHNSHSRCVYPFAARPVHQQPVVLPDGRFIPTIKVRGKGAVLMAVDTRDGGAPKTGAFGPALGTEKTGYACLAAAPDGKTIYISGTASQKRFKPIKWKHAVYRANWKDKAITPFIGKPEEAGKGAEGLNQPQGLAVDKAGNIYVADRGNNRVVVFSSAGKLLSELPVDSPYMLGVHRKSGAVYVLGGGDPPDHIVKFQSHKNPKPVYSQKVPGVMQALKGHRRITSYPVFALDDSEEESVLWVGSSTAWDRFRLFRFVEKDGRLGAPEEKSKSSLFRDCMEIQVDRKREEVYFYQGGGIGDRGGRIIKVNGTDGKILKSLHGKGDVGSHFALGYDDHVYVVRGYGDAKPIYRYDRDFKPAPFPGRDTNVSDPLTGHKCSNHVMGRGLAVRRDGTIYLLHENLPQVHQRYGVSAWGPDGKIKKENLIASLSQGALSLRTDPAGNLYVGDPVKPVGQPVPPDLTGKVDATKKRPVDHHYPIMYGSIVKFPPTGGAGIGPEVKGRKAMLAYDAPVEIRDDLWRYFGVGPVPAYKGGTFKHHALQACSCFGMRFDVDGYGRVFAPDAARFRVVVLDTGGNKIGTFGEYGNEDSAGPGSAVPRPNIPFAWPMAVGVSDRAAYVSDTLSRRILRVKLGHAVSKELSVTAR